MAVRAWIPDGLTHDLKEPMIMNMTMAQLYGAWSKGEPNYSREAADMYAAMQAVITKEGKRDRGLKTDDIILAALGVLQDTWDRHMSELRTIAVEPRPIDRGRRKKGRLTGFWG